MVLGALTGVGCASEAGSLGCAVDALPTPPRCESHPALCNLPVTRDVRTDDPRFAVDLVFVPEGFPAASLGRFRRRVDELLQRLDRDPSSIVGRDPARFNRYRIDLTTRGSATDDDLQDTPLRGCLRRDELLPGGQPLLTAHPLLSRFVARANVPEADIVVVLHNTDAGRANAPVQLEPDVDFGMISLGLQHDFRVLDHELGHALVHLGDEYVELETCYADGLSAPPLGTSPGEWWTGLGYTPNLATDPAGTRWQHLVAGARPGGARHRRCIVHPTDRCRMGDDDRQPFCPVCDDAITRTLQSFRDGVDHRPPLCALYVAALSVNPLAHRVCPIALGPGPTRFLVQDADGTRLLDGVRTPPAANSTPMPSLGPLGSGCASLSWETRREDQTTLRIQCWTATGATTENTLTLTRPRAP